MDDFAKKEKEYKVENVWNKECEELLAEWSEKASCYRWLHGRCEKNYRKWYYSFSIPVIILSTLTGAANVGMDSFIPPESKSIASAIVGGVNILAGIISTLQNFLKVAEYMEAHRIAGVSWGKLQRNIAIELALDPCRRVIQSDFLKLSRAEYDRLIEAGPIIDDSVINQFNKKFKNYGVSVPSICNGLDKCNVYKIDPSIKMNQEELTEGIEDIIKNQDKEINESEKDNTQVIIKLNKDDLNKDDLNKDDLNKDDLNKDDLNKDDLNKDSLDKDSLDKDDLNKDSLDKDSLDKDSLDKDSLDEDDLVEDSLDKDTQTENLIPVIDNEDDLSNS